MICQVRQTLFFRHLHFIAESQIAYQTENG
jgi:hypothetical protein